MDLLTAVVLTVEIVSALLLILFVLLHSGQGGGMSDMFGGGMGSIASGSSVAERNLDRITIATALVFTFSTVILSIRLQ
jgi:preprotein translocase subunit SecG